MVALRNTTKEFNYNYSMVKENKNHSTDLMYNTILCKKNNDSGSPFLNRKVISPKLKEQISSLVKVFYTSLAEKAEYFELEKLNGFKLINYSFINTALALFILFPDHIGMEVTSSGTLYYVMSKDDFKLHIETSFYYDDNEDDLVVSLFKGDEIYLNIAGTIDDVFPKIYKFLDPTLVSKNIRFRN
jgi:hypothetical protein